MTEAAVRAMMPSRGWIPSYVRYARTLTDAPDIYHLATALTIYSAVIAPRVELRGLGRARMPLHLWMLLVGASGDARKSTAINIGLRTLLGVGIPNTPTPIPVFGLVDSPTAVFDMLAQTRYGLLVHAEAASLFSVLRSRRWQDAAGLLPELYEGNSMKRTLVGPPRRTLGPDGKKAPPSILEIEIRDPRFAFLGGLAWSQMHELLDGAGSSLLGRMLPIVGERGRFLEVPRRPSPSAEIRLRRLFSVATNRNEERLDGCAWEVYRQWCRELDRESRARTRSAEMSGLERSLRVRLTAHVLRIAGLYHLSSLEVSSREAMQAAIAFGDHLKDSIHSLVLPVPKPLPLKRPRSRAVRGARR